MTATAYFPLRKKGASISDTTQADYKIVESTALTSAQKTALANGTGVKLSGTVYVLAQPLPAGVTGFASAQGAADYLLQQTPSLENASWFKKYAGPAWERIIAGVGGIVALGAAGAGDSDDDSSGDSTGADDSDDSDDDDSKGSSALAGLTALGFLGMLTEGNLWVRIAKVVVGGAILLIGLAHLTGLNKEIDGVAGQVIKAAPLL